MRHSVLCMGSPSGGRHRLACTRLGTIRPPLGLAQDHTGRRCVAHPSRRWIVLGIAAAQPTFLPRHPERIRERSRMAQDSANAARIKALCQRSECARSVLSEQIGILRHRANLPARLRASVATSPYAWFGGSLAAGLCSFLLFRRKSPYREAPRRKSMFVCLLAAVATAAKPLVQAWLVGELKSRLQPFMQRQDHTR